MLSPCGRHYSAADVCFPGILPCDWACRTPVLARQERGPLRSRAWRGRADRSVYLGDGQGNGAPGPREGWSKPSAAVVAANPSSSRARRDWKTLGRAPEDPPPVRNLGNPREMCRACYAARTYSFSMSTSPFVNMCVRRCAFRFDVASCTVYTGDLASRVEHAITQRQQVP